jgi:hypothetical protein
VLLDRVHGVGASRICRGRNHVWLRADHDDVRAMSTSGPFGVIGVNCSPFERTNGGLDKTRLVEGIGM